MPYNILQSVNHHPTRSHHCPGSSKSTISTSPFLGIVILIHFQVLFTAVMETNDPITMLPGLTIGHGLVNQQLLGMNLYLTINGFTNLFKVRFYCPRMETNDLRTHETGLKLQLKD